MLEAQGSLGAYLPLCTLKSAAKMGDKDVHAESTNPNFGKGWIELVDAALPPLLFGPRAGVANGRAYVHLGILNCALSTCILKS